MRVSRLVATALLLLGSCSTETPPLPVSRGLKIFVTSGVHGADFADDPLLTGANAIAKADAFCNSDPAKPSSATYKALIVDGVNRDAKTPVDWVLKPSTAYYRAHGDVLIGTTTSSSIFGAAYQPLANCIAEPASLFGPPPASEVWTGIGNSSDFASGEDCVHWTNMTNAFDARWGRPEATNGDAFSTNGLIGCAAYQLPIYCVEQ